MNDNSLARIIAAADEMIAARGKAPDGQIQNIEFLAHAWFHAARQAEALKVLAEELRTKCMCYGAGDPRASRDPCPACRAMLRATAILEQGGA